MRISLVVSFLISGALAESTVEKSSSFRDFVQSYPAQRDEFLQYSNEQITGVLAQIPPTNANHRDLQATAAPTRAPLCNSDTSVNFDDDLAQVAYADIFNSTCSCSEGSLNAYSPYRLQFDEILSNCAAAFHD
jgi:hypothetical protein